MARSFIQGANKWRQVRLGLEGEMKKSLDRFRQKTVVHQQFRMIDTPEEHEWRYGDDPRPLRIVRSRLWLSLRGPNRLDPDISAGTGLPATARRYPIEQGGVSEHYQKFDIKRTGFSVMATLTFGTSTPYAPILEKHRKKRFRTFYPGIKDAWSAEGSLINITGYISRVLRAGI